MLVLSDKLYNTCKRLVQVVIPACSSLYFGLAQIWGLPGAEQVVGTLALLATFLGVIVGISSSTFTKLNGPRAAPGGTIVISEDEETGKKHFSLEVAGNIADLENFGAISFKVDKR